MKETEKIMRNKVEKKRKKKGRLYKRIMISSYVTLIFVVICIIILGFMW